MSLARMATADTSDPTLPTIRGWVSLCLAWSAVIVLILVALPLHVCLPLWTDAHLFDVAARVLLRSGAVYRELFYHAPPGMIFAQATVRGLFGWRGEVLRAADFLFVASSVALLTFCVLPRPQCPAARVWGTALLLFFYLGTPESCHCQPDFWMLLPALVALSLRIRQVRVLMQTDASPWWVTWEGLGEGVCWGLGVLFKPSVMLPAAACWVVTVALVRRRGVSGGRLAADIGGLLAGGLLVGGAVIAWLVCSGNWPYFKEAMFGDWLGEYHKTSPTLQSRTFNAIVLPWPWGFVHLAAVPLALFHIVSALHHASRRTANNLTETTALALLGAFYLLWFAQANFFQRQMTYHQGSAVLLALAVVLGHGWSSRWHLGWSAGLIALTLWAAVDHPVLRPSRLSLWGRCWIEGGSPTLRDALTLGPHNPAVPTHTDLEAVSNYLRAQHLADHELTCFTGSTLSLYTDLDVLPSTRYVQLSTFLTVFPSYRPRILRELNEGPQRFVVWDARTLTRSAEDDRGAVVVSEGLADEMAFFREPIVFRAGRFVIHRVRPPSERSSSPPSIGPVRIPATVPTSRPEVQR